MSAAEIIEQIKTLPADQQGEVLRYLQQSKPVESHGGVRYAEPAAFEAAAHRVFEKHDELLRRLAQ
ncbi:MAG: hypothetical protein JWQ44_1400 [Chthoniobacter sp.]|nr:hypothetical protein [Chthoniobacter sp.]